MGFLLFKAFTTLIVVLSIAWVTERHGEKWGASLSGFPNTFGLATLFFGLALGKAFVIEMIPFALASLLVIMVFCATWVYALRVSTRLWFAPWLALTAYGLSALVLARFSFSIAAGALVALVSIGFAILLFRKFPSRPLSRKPLTLSELIFRVTFVLVLVLAITESGGFLGARVAGILALFPMNLFPLLFILQRRYGGDAVITLVRSFPLRVTASVCFGFSLYGLLHVFDFILAWCLAIGVATIVAIGIARFEQRMMSMVFRAKKTAIAD